MKFYSKVLFNYSGALFFSTSFIATWLVVILVLFSQVMEELPETNSGVIVIVSPSMPAPIPVPSVNVITPAATLALATSFVL